MLRRRGRLLQPIPSNLTLAAANILTLAVSLVTQNPTSLATNNNNNNYNNTTVAAAATHRHRHHQHHYYQYYHHSHPQQQVGGSSSSSNEGVKSNLLPSTDDLPRVTNTRRSVTTIVDYLTTTSSTTTNTTTTRNQQPRHSPSPIGGTLFPYANTIPNPNPFLPPYSSSPAHIPPQLQACLEQVVGGLEGNESTSPQHTLQPPSHPPPLCSNATLPLDGDGGRGGLARGGTGEDETYLFDRADVRGTLIALYTLVFITGLVGNVVVLLVMWVHPRMRSTTNFFLTNLAIADFFVTIFCVYQNLSLYLAQTWVFGDFLCKMYNFVHYLSYTASVMILVVNCVERYVAIMCPFRAKTILSHRNLVVSLAVVWAGSGVYCCPRLLYFRAGAHELPGGQFEVICLADRELYDSQTFDTINFLLLYVMPLTVISILYWRIGRYLWVNGRQIEEAKMYRNSTNQSGALSHTHTPSRHPPKAPCHATHQTCHPPQNNCHATPCHASQSPCCITAMKEDLLKDNPRSREERPRSVCSGGGTNGVGGKGVEVHHHSAGGHSSSSHGCYFTTPRRRRWRQPGDMPLGPYHSDRLISTWRKVVKLLVAVVSCFALCNLPFHLRKMLTYYHPAYNHTTDAALMFTPLSYLLMYLNSALNPILYSFMSHNFRACVRDVLTRYTRRGKRRHPSGPHNPQHRHAHTNPPPSLQAHTHNPPSIHAHTNPPPLINPQQTESRP